MEIIPHVYQITIRGINIILIAEEKLTLIDTGFRGSSPKITSFIHRLGRSVEEIALIILTHNHLDHVGALSELRKLTTARVAAHKADIGEPNTQFLYPGAIRRLLHFPPFPLLRPLVFVEPGEVDTPLEGGEVLAPLGGLEVIHTPGHTPGSISLFSPEKKLLIVGDALNNRYKTLRLPPKLISTNFSQAMDSVRRIARLDFDIICFGHGRPLTRDAQAKVQDLVKKRCL